MKRIAMLLLVAVLSLGVLTACGGGGGGNVTELTVEMGINGEMKFTPDVLEVNEGDTVKITLVNKDPAVAHNFLIPALNVNSGQVPAGQTASIQVKASKKGEHEIICDVPGHRESGMTGKLIVK
ncbi:putative cupredoxin-like copper-binding protein [Symbiobacterium terraclitae]|uniref:Cupredoxin-like copper-binding protein n=1 Tax=Symbiobacterium terraclitae TaxID=557451 RepID=A0ABS4JTY7_9FIRM|nr:cupredoxin domain-containing protein [Symbiobacterium terraclitae]MBP2018346.1 putative cupredoxin-like copper-binding protein [Symbiobacterium terraclitae]